MSKMNKIRSFSWFCPPRQMDRFEQKRLAKYNRLTVWNCWCRFFFIFYFFKYFLLYFLAKHLCVESRQTCKAASRPGRKRKNGVVSSDLFPIIFFFPIFFFLKDQLFFLLSCFNLLFLYMKYRNNLVWFLWLICELISSISLSWIVLFNIVHVVFYEH